MTINNSWRILENGYWPLTTFLKISFEIHEPIKSDSMPFDEIFKKTDIDKKIKNLQRPRGIGLFLIKHLVDQLEFNQITDRGHGVRMIFRNKKKAAAHREKTCAKTSAPVSRPASVSIPTLFALLFGERSSHILVFKDM